MRAKRKYFDFLRGSKKQPCILVQKTMIHQVFYQAQEDSCIQFEHFLYLKPLGFGTHSQFTKSKSVV